MPNRTIVGTVAPFTFLTFRSSVGGRWVVRSDRAGNFSISLTANAEYEFDSGEGGFRFVLPAGTTPIDLVTLKNLSNPLTSQPPTLLEQVEELVNARLSGIDSGRIYQKTFTDSDLSVAGKLPVIHGLNDVITNVRVTTNQGEEALPDSIKPESLNTLAIGLASFRPIEGSWKVVVSVS
ncbi:hypothetical protein LEP3755_34300 [Leptolyngbya sp. NIES-3755]|nr:hypothetical protein LEP3755_34300 [Leptolyngbya sp. NIES-3755]